ncbi:MAG: hypothetical protein JNL58_05605 [Planctomyces sp.]|nr:hypothetical protein [Planctomyces sp.]
MTKAANELIPLNACRSQLIPQSSDGKSLNCSTLWRWVRRGLRGANGERIKLEVVYVGRTPHVSAEMVERFFQRVTAARLEQAAQRDAQKDVNALELESAGLIPRRAK